MGSNWGVAAMSVSHIWDITFTGNKLNTEHKNLPPIYDHTWKQVKKYPLEENLLRIYFMKTTTKIPIYQKKKKNYKETYYRKNLVHNTH